MVIAEGRGCLIDRFARVLQIIAGIFGDHGLQLNDKRGKAMVTLQYTVQTKAVKQCIRGLDHIVVSMGARKDLSIHVTHIYKHLGGQVCSNSDTREEIAYRAGTSHSVERVFRKNLFANPRLPLPMRLMFLSSLSFSELFFNCGTWTSLSDLALKKLDSCFHRSLSMVTLHRDPAQHVTNVRLRALCNLPPATVWLTCSRLSLYIATIVCTGGFLGILAFTTHLPGSRRLGTHG